MVDSRSRPRLELAFTLYRRILHRVIGNDFNVFEHRLAVPPWQRATIAERVAAHSADTGVTASLCSSSRSTPTRRN